MHHNFQCIALTPAPFSGYFEKSPSELAQLGAKRMRVDKKPGFPCRISLEDAEIGEEVLLFPFVHHAVASPYQASGPIFIRKGVEAARPGVNEIPGMLQHRLLSLRGYDKDHLMVAAAVVEGRDLAASIGQLFDNEKIEYLHLHNAKQGCYNCSVIKIP